MNRKISHNDIVVTKAEERLTTNAYTKHIFVVHKNAENLICNNCLYKPIMQNNLKLI